MSHQPRRLLILGTGTGIGKTYVSVRLTRALLRRGLGVLALKPIESGVPSGGSALPRGILAPDARADRVANDSAPLASTANAGEPPPDALSDAEALAQACGFRSGHCYALPEPLSPHLAARRAGVEIGIETVAGWVQDQERDAQRSGQRVDITLIETAGGVFSPVSIGLTNHDLAISLDSPNATWLLVAPDSLGVLHDVSACLRATSGAGRVPDLVVLSQARAPDASTGSNAHEMESWLLNHLKSHAPQRHRVPVLLRGTEGESGQEADCDDFVSEVLALLDRA